MHSISYDRNESLQLSNGRLRSLVEVRNLFILLPYTLDEAHHNLFW